MTSSLLLFAGCNQNTSKIKPQIHYSVQDRYLQQLPSPYSDLPSEEKETRWGTEYLIGRGFAKQLDLYRAITAFRRAEILLPEGKEREKIDLQYQTLFSYYLGRRYQEVEKTFSESILRKVSTDDPLFHDLLVILYDTYFQLKDKEKNAQVLNITKEYYPETAKNLVLYSALQEADFPSLQQISGENKELHTFLKLYDTQKKSAKIAMTLNALFPGAGYFYLGQIPTAITALLVNGLFLFAALYFFLKRPWVVAIIFLGFEIGWYFGGIQGASSGAKLYNERTYEQLAKSLMNKNSLFPVYQLQYGF